MIFILDIRGISCSRYFVVRGENRSASIFVALGVTPELLWRLSLGRDLYLVSFMLQKVENILSG